ncbi:MAG: hypothetical protein M1829_000451 [Trizodia sp. TS-e1964]|nr:MAG: hypothetical protein M1829_000451 [Trizodia sp. TS-e1964]
MTAIESPNSPWGFSAGERDARVEGYIDDKFQDVSDLKDLDSVLLNVQNQQVLLRSQLQDAEKSLEESQQALDNHDSRVLQQANIFRRQQTEIDKRLRAVTKSDVTDDAYRKFRGAVDKLKWLDVTKGYLELLQELDQLIEDARGKMNTSPRAALKSHTRLQHLAQALEALQPAAEGAAPHIIDHIHGVAKWLWNHMKDSISSELEAVLVDMGWPNKHCALNGDIGRRWSDAVVKLLEFQEPELLARENEAFFLNVSPEPIVLLPLEVMVKPLELRFRYHFDGDRPTNRPDKPEYFLSHVFNLLNSYDGFFSKYLGPLLRSSFRKTHLALNPIYIDPTSALITALLPMLRRKISSLMPEISSEPQLLSHLMHEIMDFDSTMRKDWMYFGEEGALGWKGVAWYVLVKENWFERWLQVEKDFALARYQGIINSKDAGEIDYDSVEPEATKPTKSAIRVNDLLGSITERYQTLSSFSQKLRFLIDIQITIFDKYHIRLSDGLDAYLAASSSVIRAVHGISKEDQQNSGNIGGLERLCRIYGSAEYMEKAMEDWSDEIFFLELWDDLQDRAKQNTGKNIAGSMTKEDVTNRTSSALGYDTEFGGLFDETASSYKRLRVRTEELIVDFTSQNLKSSLKAYSRISSWSALGLESIAPPTMPSISPELSFPLRQLTSDIKFLSSALGRAPLRRVLRSVSDVLETYIWDNVVIRNTFSAHGVAQLSEDFSGLCGTFEAQLGLRITWMQKLKEGIHLLGLPTALADGASTGLTLKEAETRVFESNEGARDVIEELGLSLLSESDARSLLQKRVELES